MHDLKALLTRMEPVIVRIEASLPHLATREQVAELRAEMISGDANQRSEITAFGAELRSEMAAFGTELRGEIAKQMTDLSGEVAKQKTDLGGEIAGGDASLRAELAALGTRLAELPSKTYLWAVLGVLMTSTLAAFGAGLAAVAILR